MNSELDFLFKSKLTNYSNLNDIYYNLNLQSYDVFNQEAADKVRQNYVKKKIKNLGKPLSISEAQETAEEAEQEAQTAGQTQGWSKTIVTRFKSNDIGTNGIKNYLKEHTEKSPNDENPYMRLLIDFNGQTPSVKLTPGDLAYLTDLGVYPLNRMVILRRFEENVVVPQNLNRFKGVNYPISTVVGWIKEDDDLGIGFNEDWGTTNDMIHEVLSEILQNEFGQKASMLQSVPGWSQGLIFAFLKEMGLTNYQATDLPFGDPNVLQEAAVRKGGGKSTEFGLESNFSFTLKTSYEQKFIGDVDPGTAMLDIINNLSKMGTSPIKYILEPNVKGNEIIQSLLTAISSNDTDSWFKFIKKVVQSFISAVKSLVKDVTNALNESLDEQEKENPGRVTWYGKHGTDELRTQETYEAQLKKYKAQIARNNDNIKREGKRVRKNNRVYEKIDKLNEEAKVEGNIDITPPSEEQEQISDLEGGVDALEGVQKLLFDTLGGVFDTILAATVAKYRWPLRGSVSVMTGWSSTPWHLTIGNPYSPFISLNNLVVNKVDLKFPTEMGFNDIPTKIDVTITLKQGRNMGAQEIVKMFNNNYSRNYGAPTAEVQKILNSE